MSYLPACHLPTLRHVATAQLRVLKPLAHIKTDTGKPYMEKLTDDGNYSLSRTALLDTSAR